MTLAALVDAGVPWAEIERPLRTLPLPEWTAEVKVVRRKGFRATHVAVHCPPEERHRHLSDILQLMEAAKLTARQRELAERIFRRLAEAEAHVHGTTPEKVHFHEVGAVDSIIDIVGAAIGLDLLGVEQAFSSPVPTGRGTIRIAHGEVSLPAPATAYLLQGVPLAAADVEAELTTPTGAAILTTIASGFGPLPPMQLEAVGCGAGARDLPDRPNILRLFVGRMEVATGPVRSTGDHVAAEPSSVSSPTRIWVLEANVDDCPGEFIGYCFGRLLEAGALDVFATPVQMKKNRPGMMLTVICQAEKIPALEEILFAETTTLGIRRFPVERTILARQRHIVQTPWGEVSGKLTWDSAWGARFAPEYEDCRRLAETVGLPLRTVYEAAIRAFDPRSVEQAK
jgi:uncharacterized protein (TIGR00299 family) protein